MNEPPHITPHEDAGPPSVTFASGGLSWTRVRTPRQLSLIAKILYGAGALAVFSGVSGLSVFVGAAALLGILAYPLFIVSYILSLTESSFPGSLEVSDSELVIQTGTKRRSIPRARVAGALVVQREVFNALVPTVEIELTSGDILTARLPDPRSAQAVVRALGFAAGGKRVHASLATPSRRLLHPLFGLFAHIFGTVFGLFVSQLAGSGSSGSYVLGYALHPLLALVAYAVVKRLTRAPEVTVGDDGVLVRGKTRSRFIPRREIASVHGDLSMGRSFAIEMKGGERIVIGGLYLSGPRRAAVARLIEERAGPSAAAADRFAHYERGGRPVAAWRDHLARSLEESGYRQNAATLDEADAVLRSAQATPEQRVGAALALRVAGQPPERIRVAVDAAADERVREALEAVAGAGDDVVLEKALRRLAV